MPKLSHCRKDTTAQYSPDWCMEHWQPVWSCVENLAKSHVADVKALVDACRAASESYGVCDCKLESCSNCGSWSAPAKVRLALAPFSKEVSNNA
jgi:hypothetical protein